MLNARKIRIIAESVCKCDRLDAKVLGELARSNLKLPVCYMASRAKMLPQRKLVVITTGSEWEVGGEFVSTHQGEFSDYATLHIWPQKWRWVDPTKAENIRRGQTKGAAVLSAACRRFSYDR